MSVQFLSKAKENLAAARICLEAGLVNACANRAYYAMYQAALAALIHYGYAMETGENKHAWIQAEFAGKLVKARKIYPGLQEHLMQVQRVRNKADYQAETVNQKQAKRMLSKAQQFFNTIQEDLT